uniref:Cytidine/deoxycytidylate deaminase family protein n=1 Tax=Rhizophora mucronata TaxID=61149 RepID=A0A2P2IRZ4_RHIMU
MEDFKSDNEAHDEHGEVVEESSSGSRRKLQGGEARLEGQVVEEFKRHGEGAEGQGEILGQRTTAMSNGFEWEMRKKSEKKLTEVEETRSRKESSPKHLRIAGTDDGDYSKGSNYIKKIDDEEERATLEVNLEKGRRKKSSQRDNQVQEQSKFRRSYQEASNIQEIHGINVEKTSKSQKQFSDREKNMMVDANLIQERRDHHHKIYKESFRKENLGRNTQQLVELSEFENFDTEGVSSFQRHSESGMKIHEGDGKRTSIVQLETRSKKQDGSTSIVSSSGAETTEQQLSPDHSALQRIQSRRGSRDVSNISVNVTNVSALHPTDIKTVADSHSTFENRVIDQGSTSTSVVKPFQGTRQTDESLPLFKSGNEASRVAKVSKSHERTSHQASSSQASLNWESQERKQLMEEDQRSSQPIMLPPSAQIFDRDSLIVDQTMEIVSEEVSMETSESGSSAFYTTSGGRTPAHLNEKYGRDRKGETFNEPLNVLGSQDALGSAHRLAESSTRVVGEFVEKARNEVLTSNIQEEKTVLVSGLVYEGEKHGGKTSGQFAFDRNQLKDRDSRQSSEGSGVKGPSDEIWDVTDPSVEHPEKEAPESSTATENLVVRRTGRSLWSIIANIVRLRWGSHAETPKSTGKSGRKSSSNESCR